MRLGLAFTLRCLIARSLDAQSETPTAHATKASFYLSPTCRLHHCFAFAKTGQKPQLSRLAEQRPGKTPPPCHPRPRPSTRTCQAQGAGGRRSERKPHLADYRGPRQGVFRPQAQPRHVSAVSRRRQEFPQTCHRRRATRSELEASRSLGPTAPEP